MLVVKPRNSRCNGAPIFIFCVNWAADGCGEVVTTNDHEDKLVFQKRFDNICLYIYICVYEERIYIYNSTL